MRRDNCLRKRLKWNEPLSKDMLGPSIESEGEGVKTSVQLPDTDAAGGQTGLGRR